MQLGHEVARLCCFSSACMGRWAQRWDWFYKGFFPSLSSSWLCRHLVDNPALVRGRHVLELGSGTGLCGIVAAKLGAAEVR